MDAPPGHDPEHRGAEREDVRPAVDVLAPPCGLLGGHERRRSDGDACARDRRCLRDPREPEVEDLHAHAFALRILREEDVLRLQVAVDDTVLMRRGEDVEHRVHDLEQLALAELRRAGGSLLERLPFEQLHHEVGGALGRSALDDVVVQHLDDAAVRDAVRRVALAQEPLADLGDARELGVEKLHRGARAVAVAGGVDRAHPAGAEEVLERPFLVEDGSHTLLGPRIHAVGHGDVIAQSHPRWFCPRRAPSCGAGSHLCIVGDCSSGVPVPIFRRPRPSDPGCSR